MPTKTDVQAWAQAQVKEMDAKIAAVQSKLSGLSGEARAKAENGLAAMRRSRDAFQQVLKKAGESVQDGSSQAKASLETHLSEFKESAKKALPHSNDSAK